jgi:hypothetical protein
MHACCTQLHGAFCVDAMEVYAVLDSACV